MSGGLGKTGSCSWLRRSVPGVSAARNWLRSSSPPGGVHLLDVLNVLKAAADLTVFDGACNYKNLRIARALALMVSKNFTDTPEEWLL